jgi:prepilin-type N-terminal cleavage/methylation domain-containing protein
MKTKAFTLIELLVVVAIIGILASLLIPGLSKARRSAKGAVCKSNLKNLITATVQYLDDNQDFFPSFSNIDASQSKNHGTHWFGQKGTQAKHTLDITERPINTYLGHNTDGQEVPIADCPIAASNGLTYFNQKGCYYHGVQRQETSKDLDRSNTESIKITNVYNPTTMAAIVEKDLYILTFSPNSEYLQFNHKPNSPTFASAFVDGHVATTTVLSGEGYQFKSSRLNLINFE